MKKGDDPMQITLDLPEDIAAQLTESRPDLSRAALESLAMEAYRSGDLAESKVRRLLGFATRYELHGFLKSHLIPLRYTEHDLDRDIENARNFTRKWLSSQTHPPSTT